MKLEICESPQQLGEKAADQAAEMLSRIIKANGSARIVLSTGASQFEFFNAFTRKNLDWGKIEMFHLDEYVGLPESHPASFRKYLKERFVQKVGIKKVHFVNGEGDIPENIRLLNEAVAEMQVDLALIGIGENAHIAFNDPPADFDKEVPFFIVDLDEACKKQQVGEGWFSAVEEVPKQAITMSVRQILSSAAIISCVPHQVKAGAVKKALEDGVTPEIPASILKTHADWTLYLDKESASKL